VATPIATATAFDDSIYPDVKPTGTKPCGFALGSPAPSAHGRNVNVGPRAGAISNGTALRKPRLAFTLRHRQKYFGGNAICSRLLLTVFLL
jgi:hypothetical protein